jgi:hypothetical protein
MAGLEGSRLEIVAVPDAGRRRSTTTESSEYGFFWVPTDAMKPSAFAE